jgi:type I restriction enzyme S subunit
MRWPSVNLDSVCLEIKNGLSIRQFTDAGGVPISRIETISKGEVDPQKVGFADVKPGEKSKRYLRKGDILFSHINSEKHIGKCAIYNDEPKPLIHGMNLLLLRPKQDVVDPKFLLYQLRSSDYRACLPAITKRAVNQASISGGNLKQTNILLPTPSEQQKIVELLDQADALRKRRAELGKKAEGILPALFYNMFGDPVSNPMGWEKKALKNYSDTSSGGTPSRKQDDFFGGDIPWVKSGELHESPVIKTQELITKAGLDGSSAKLCPAGSVLLAMYGATVGETAILGIEAATNQAVCCLVPHRKKMTSEFLYVQLLLLKEVLLGQRAGGAQPNISQRKIRDLEIIAPDFSLQECFVIAFNELLRIGEIKKGICMKIDDLWNQLLHRAFTGDLTAKWREAHMKELLEEMEIQAKELKLELPA